MNNLNIIPPHFINFLKHEEISITDFENSNLSSKNYYDKMLVHFPYCNTTLTVQVIFDIFDFTSPPDFIVLNDEYLFLDYNEVIKNFSFRESSSLFFALFRIKQIFSSNQLKKILSLIQKEKSSKNQNTQMSPSHFFAASNIREVTTVDFIEKMIIFINSNLKSYKAIPKSLVSLDILIKYEEDRTTISQVILSYPLDISVRGRSIKKAPILNIIVPFDSEMKFWVELDLPHYVGREGFNMLKESEDLNNFKTYISLYEKFILTQISLMKSREEMILFIIDMDLGFLIEVDTKNFLYVCFFLSVRIEEKTINLALKFLFSNEFINSFELQILDIDQLQIIVRIKIPYNINYMEQAGDSIKSTIEKCIMIPKKKEVEESEDNTE